MQDYTLNRIKNTSKPIVVLFFGTCELTNKVGRYIHLPDNIENRIEEVIKSYAIYKERILQYNRDAVVIFLDCPYFSIVIWNFLRKHPYPGIFESDQRILEESILTFNRKLKDLNGDIVVPRLALDFMFSTKKKGKQI